MTAGQVIINVLLIATVPAAVLIVYRQERTTVRLGLVTGAAAAALVVIVLLAGRRNLPIAADMMLMVVVVTEEAAKFLAVTVLLHHRSRWSRLTTGHAAARLNPAGTVGWSVGAGFAAAEHLLYATAAPRIILMRIAGAGIVHLVTARLYSNALAPFFIDDDAYPARRRRSSPSSGARLRRIHRESSPGGRALAVAATLAAGLLLHLGYNLLTRRLDQIPVLW